MIIKYLKIEEFSVYENTILELLVNSYESNFNISISECEGICKEKIQMLKKYILDGSANVIGVIVQDELAGFLWTYIHDYFGEKRIHINQIAVKKEYRGKGIAKLMLNELDSFAIAQGIDVIDLFVSEINENALNLYEKIGFITERRYMKRKL